MNPEPASAGGTRRICAAPTGLGFNFPLYPALRLRLRAGLSCFVPSGLCCSDSYSLILSLAEIPRATNVSAAPPPSASLGACPESRSAGRNKKAQRFSAGKEWLTIRVPRARHMKERRQRNALPSPGNSHLRLDDHPPLKRWAITFRARGARVVAVRQPHRVPRCGMEELDLARR